MKGQEDLLFWVWLAEQLGAQNRDFRHLITLYRNPYDIFQLDPSELDRDPNLTPKTRRVLSDKGLERAREVIGECVRLGYRILPYGDMDYPVRLREIPEPPIVLYCDGELRDFNEHINIAMVGTRRMSEYGMRAAYKIAYELTGANAVIVSGMAAGIDGVAATAAMAAGGKTVAVLGCGLDTVYPKHHRLLWSKIRQHGAVVSEYPPKTRPNRYQFPVRNRIISGMSLGTVVVEAGLRSGSLITAKDAIMQGRDVFAVPSNIDSQGADGTNGLLHAGANLVLSSDDVLKHYKFLYEEKIDLKGFEAAKLHSDVNVGILERIGVIEPIRPTPTPVDTWCAPSTKRQKTETAQKPRQEEAKQKEAKQKEAKREEAKREETRREVGVGEQQTMFSAPAEPQPRLLQLSPLQIRVLETMPDDRPTSIDTLVKAGISFGDAISALTMLEVMGLIRKLPGGLYSKA